MSATHLLPRIAPSFRASFERHAALESILTHLAARRAERAELDRQITWLEGLLAQRKGV